MCTLQYTQLRSGNAYSHIKNYSACSYIASDVANEWSTGISQQEYSTL